ncbi:energy transducer TonB [Swingsia samuiensis]|uniref:Energy transducer TonB n=1 Tax=Swingsia samuiensis TaxID=1293412 RepID=A0A4Y6UI65_9PROT|nr:energy transducer TonB [Swingsia samuiensis]QDH17289.1 energy transducer TonB [Swingsia samuiensis]
MVRPRRSDRRCFRAALLGSVGIHAALILFFVLKTPFQKPPEPPEPPAVQMEFDTPGPPTHPIKAERPAPKPAPAPAPVKNAAPPAPTPPVKAPTEEPPPPPPPPQPVPPPPETKPVKLPPMKLPPKLTSPTPEAVRAAPPRPSPPSPSRMVAPPSPQTHPTDKLPDTPKFSHFTQPNASKHTQSDSHSLLATLDSFRADQKQTHSPHSRPNPPQGGAPGGGGVPNGDITQGLSAAEQRAVGASVRRCYTEDTEARDYAKFFAHMIVTVDSTGEARLVNFAPDTLAKMRSDPSYRAFAERARDAVLSPTCAHLPIPAHLLGRTGKMRFVFRP